MWKQGRQGGGYKKLLLFKTHRMDCWLLKYEPHFEMPEHIDEVRNKKHYRLNIELWGKGEFKCEKTIFNLFGKIILFRPDLYKHSVTNGLSNRYVFSLGWVK